MVDEKYEVFLIKTCHILSSKDLQDKIYHGDMLKICMRLTLKSRSHLKTTLDEISTDPLLIDFLPAAIAIVKIQNFQCHAGKYQTHLGRTRIPSNKIFLTAERAPHVILVTSCVKNEDTQKH